MIWARTCFQRSALMLRGNKRYGTNPMPRRSRPNNQPGIFAFWHLTVSCYAHIWLGGTSVGSVPPLYRTIRLRCKSIGVLQLRWLMQSFWGFRLRGARRHTLLFKLLLVGEGRLRSRKADLTIPDKNSGILRAGRFSAERRSSIVDYIVTALRQDRAPNSIKCQGWGLVSWISTAMKMKYVVE